MDEIGARDPITGAAFSLAANIAASPKKSLDNGSNDDEQQRVPMPWETVSVPPDHASKTGGATGPTAECLAIQRVRGEIVSVVSREQKGDC